MARPAAFRPTATGVYYRQLGYTPTGSQPRFNIGTDRAVAMVRAARLERLWELVCERHASMHGADGHGGPATDGGPRRPYWDEVSLAVARSVAEGAPRHVLPPHPEMRDPDSYVYWVARYADAYGSVIPVVPADPHLYAEGMRAEAAARQEYLSEVVRRVAVAFPACGEVRLPTGRTVHQALDAYRVHVRATRRDAEGRVTEWGETLSALVDHLRRLTPDRDLSEFGQVAIDAAIETIRRRPPARTHAAKGRARVSRRYAANLLKAFRLFIRWLHRSEQFAWRRPDEYEVTPVAIPKTDEERARSLRSVQVETYAPDELALLWRYASPVERLLAVLALNCGFGQRELATCRRDEIHVRCVHPHARLLGLPGDVTGSWIMRLRTKTDVYGEWQLWPVTEAAVGWYTARRPASESPRLLVSAAGRDFATPTAGNNSNRFIANAWADLIGRVRRDHPQFRRLSFNKLRKTSVNQIRQQSGSELASLFAAHGRPFAADDLIEVYANKPFARLHDAIAALGRWLQPVWESTPDPFPAAWVAVGRRGGPNISRGQIDRITELHAAGSRIADIARETGLSRETVRRWVRRAQRPDRGD